MPHDRALRQVGTPHRRRTHTPGAPGGYSVGRAMTELTFTIPKTLWLSANQRLHWAEKARRVKALREAGRIETLLRGTRGLGPTHIAAFIGYPRNGRADPSNCADTIKALVDGATDAGAWPDDDHTHVIGPTFLRGPASGTPGIYRVRLVLTPQEIPWT